MFLESVWKIEKKNYFDLPSNIVDMSSTKYSGGINVNFVNQPEKDAQPEKDDTLLTHKF